jgi:uncharacterized membrane protein
MSNATAQDQQEARLHALETRLETAIDVIGGEVGSFEARLRRLELAGGLVPAAARVAPADPPRRNPHRTATGRAHAAGIAPDRARPERTRADNHRRAAPAAAPRAGTLGDLIGGRLLAWAGGTATLLGIALFLALAISRGWIGEAGRVTLAGGGSLALLTAGIWLHSRRGHTEAAVAMTGAAVAGLFATLIVASSVYHLIPALLALALSLVVGAAATALAIRWAGRALAALGLIGALASPALVGAPQAWPTLAMLLTTAAFAMWVAARRRWGWLALAAAAVCAPQWAVPMLEGQSAGEDFAVLAAFALLGLLGPAAAARGRDEDRRPAALAALILSAAATAVVGRAALAASADATAATVWLAALACAHLGLAAVSRRVALGAGPRTVLVGLGVALGDVALALSVHGVLLEAGWALGAVALSLLARRGGERGPLSTAGDLGVAAQASLALVRALVTAPPAMLFSGQPQLAATGSLAVVAAACIGCAQLVRRRRLASDVLAGSGLATLGYLMAVTLDGPVLVVAWASQAGVLLALARRAGERMTQVAGCGFAAAAVLYTLVSVAAPTGLGGGAELGASTIALAALATLAWRGARFFAPGSPRRRMCRIATGGAVLYLASLGEASLPEGQVALSALWAVSGLCLLVGGLRADDATLRSVALGLLLATIAKVFLYDLSTLTSLARVVSFLVLGMLLMAAAHAYQRLRPPPRPDLRTVEADQR